MQPFKTLALDHNGHKKIATDIYSDCLLPTYCVSTFRLLEEKNWIRKPL